jgi:hypothetical protein
MGGTPDRRVGGWMMNGWVGGWMEEWMDGWTNRPVGGKVGRLTWLTDWQTDWLILLFRVATFEEVLQLNLFALRSLPQICTAMITDVEFCISHWGNDILSIKVCTKSCSFRGKVTISSFEVNQYPKRMRKDRNVALSSNEHPSLELTPPHPRSAVTSAVWNLHRLH